MEVRFFNPGKAYSQVRDAMLGEIDRVLSAGDLVLRADLERFEKNLAAYTGKKHAIGLNSCTDALYLSLWALGIGKDDEVIVPSHTFVASAQVVQQLGAIPVLVDCGDDLLSHAKDFAAALTKKTKAIIPVHLTGSVVDVADMLPFDVPIVEDAAQALGAQGVGFGKTQCYSFYPAKILGAYGDAGAVTTDDDDLADEIRQLRNHYKRDYSKWGINSRLDNVQAAVLDMKLAQIGETHLKRAQVAVRYNSGLQRIVGVPEMNEGRVWQDYVIRTEKRDELYEYMKEKGVETMKNEYPMPIPKTPNSLKIEAETLRIPCNEHLTDAEVEYVIQVIQSFYETA